MNTSIRISTGFNAAVLEEYNTKTKKSNDIVTGIWIKPCGDYYLVKIADNDFLLYCVNKYGKAVISKKDIKDAFWHNGELLYRKDDFHWYRKRGDGGKMPLGDDLMYFFASYENKQFMVSYLDSKERWVKAGYNDYTPYHDGHVLLKKEDGFFDIMQGKNRLLHKVSKKEVVLFGEEGYYQIFRMVKTADGYGYQKFMQGYNYVPPPKPRLNLFVLGRKLVYWFIEKINASKVYN